MSKPMIIKCNLMLTDKELEELRQKWNSQAAEEVIVLPPGFELVKNEEMDEIYKLFKGMTPKMQSAIKEIMEIDQISRQNPLEEELEKIKAEIEELANDEWNIQVGADKGLELAIDVVEDRIDNLKRRINNELM